MKWVSAYIEREGERESERENMFYYEGKKIHFLFIDGCIFSAKVEDAEHLDTHSHTHAQPLPPEISVSIYV